MSIAEQAPYSQISVPKDSKVKDSLVNTIHRGTLFSLYPKV